MFRDVSSGNTYNYGDALYWDARYIQEGGSFDWYQRYSALRPFVRKYFLISSRVLMVGCGNAVMSEDMVKDGYEDIMNIDISSVAIDMMRKKHECIPQLKYMQMDVRDMSFFPDGSFGGVLDKARPGFEKCEGDSSSTRSYLEPIPTTDKGSLPADFVLEDPDSHFIYVCKKLDETKLRHQTIH
ncbi:Methyltransferase type [Parasponia andersonii]|uniref:Methyltransferase type n=1 Tax=Parasponia andersonii TaxID=3476 RepID=A0A2P5DLZ0_PARAD|nr:Methyltransferase type [Parasponia andersonii]